MLRYFLFYKPYQVLTQFSAEGEKKTLAHFFKNIPKDVYPVGRLDFDSEGLLLLSNDKKLTQQLLEPRNKHERTYYVQVEGILDEIARQKLEQGVEINVDGALYKTLPSKARIIEAEPHLPERNPPIRFRKNIHNFFIFFIFYKFVNFCSMKKIIAIFLPILQSGVLVI